MVMVSWNMVYVTAFFVLSLTFSKALEIQLCGSQLADLLQDVCEGRFHWAPRNGRLPQMRKKNVRQYLSGTPIRLQPGIVRECCEQACPLYEIGRYCSDSPGTYVAKTTNATIALPLTPVPTITTALPSSTLARPELSRLLSRGRSFFFVARPRPTRSPVV